MKKVAIIGAGMAGAGAAWFLRKAGCEVSVFEREDFVGGRTHTHRGDGFHCNTGAGFFTNFYPLLRALVKETGLDHEVRENPKQVTLAKEDQHFAYQLDSALSFFRIPFLSFSDKLRVLRLTIALTLKKKRLDLVDPEALSAFDTESIANFALRKVGRNAFENIVRSAIEPYWYFASEQGSAAMLMALQAHAAGARFFTLTSGMDSLARTLFSDMDVRLSTPVQSLALPRSGGTVIEAASGPSLHFDAAVFATTASAATHLLRPHTEKVPSDLFDFLASQTYASNINAYYHVPQAYIQGMSPQISPITSDNHGLAAIALHGSHVDTELHLGGSMLGAWLLDSSSRELLDEDRSEAEIADHIWRTMRIYRSDLPAAMPALAKLNARREAIPLHAPGRYRLAAKAWQSQRPPLVVAGDCLATATMEGALVSGRRAAHILTESF